MNRVLVLLLLILALGAAAGYYLRSETGYVLISYGGWVIETSVLGFIASVMGLLLILVYGTRLLVALVRLPGTIKEFMVARRQRRSQESFESGLQKLLEGRWQQAEVELVRRAADHETPGLNYLLAARAAQQAGAPDRREQYLKLAEQQNDPTAFAAKLLRAELQIERGEHASALVVLQELHPKDPEHPQIAALLADALARAGQWDDLRKLLITAPSQRALTPEQYRQRLASALRELLVKAGQDARLDALKSVWDGAPVFAREQPAVRLAYVQGLARLGADAEAAGSILQTLKQSWDGDLVRLYSELGGLDAVTQLATAEQWLSQHGEKPELLLAAGRACLRNQLWGKARSYLDAALRLQPAPEIYLALAKLCAETRNPEEAGRFYKQGLELAAAK